MTELKLPELGEGIESGTVINIMVAVGDTITLEQSLMEVETDKVVVEVPSDAEGVVTEILVNTGDQISQGTPIIRLQGGDTAQEMETPEVAEIKVAESDTAVLVQEAQVKTEVVNKTTSKKAAVSEIKLPSLGEGIENGTIIAIHVAEGDTIAAEQTLMEVETDKVVVEVPADFAGEITEILVKIGDEVGEGTPIIKISSGASEVAEEEPVAPVVEEKAVEVKEVVKVEIPVNVETTPLAKNDAKRNGRFRASPLAKKVAREIGIDIATMPLKSGSNRISVQDVKNYAKALNQNRASGGGAAMAMATLPDLSKWGAIRSEAMTGIMQATSKNMTTSWSNIPHAWLQEKVDITYLEQKRQAHKGAFKAKGSSLTITGILVKVVAKALEDFPIFNASIDTQNSAIVYKDYINVGVAVDSDRGLMVPVLKNANEKSITDISYELGNLAEKVKSKKIGMDDLDGGTFTISNLGGIGTSAIFPLVSFPQVAILGVAGSQTEAVHIDGQFQPRLIMPLTIGFDHRIINGADAARFLKHVKTLLEDWFMWKL
ncbi:dihydrolipoyllysine-residue acetyltransferase [Maribacter algarum]|uniref:Dihydrolipoamide acetyltransferase component of pyruvate dehydrogenase complex n=1 Tax=Maribacter algarum (ex Zhang et al. 2020) TaxID=2578118 RepID=A0A5S3PUM1_9FLAO|nr:2-oxo acid dehydrogenase subunit E2 [Maribacter algarum]TMM58640.1 dihydrolipoyllysine-residue acetyltransferase [Maribacter algarum]